MNRSNTMLICLIVLFAAVSGIAQAHHSFAVHYDPSRTIEIGGVVVDYQLRSPHTLLRLEVKQEDGAVQLWEVEAASLPHMRREGFDDDTFEEGDVITAFGFPSRIPDKPAILVLPYLKPGFETDGVYSVRIGFDAPPRKFAEFEVRLPKKGETVTF